MLWGKEEGRGIGFVPWQNKTFALEMPKVVLRDLVFLFPVKKELEIEQSKQTQKGLDLGNCLQSCHYFGVLLLSALFKSLGVQFHEFFYKNLFLCLISFIETLLSPKYFPLPR